MGFIEDALTALVAHVTVGFLHQLGEGESEVVEKVRRLQQLIDRDTTLTGVIRESVSFMSNEVKSNKALGQGLRTFFNSPELHAIARQLFAFKLDSTSYSDALSSIRLELRSLLLLFLGTQKDRDIERTTEEVFNAVLKGCERGLQMAIDKGYLSAHEAASTSRHRVVLDELAGIKDNLAFLCGDGIPSVSQIEEFERAFRREVGQNHKSIKPPHFDASKRIAIDRLYVPSDFIRRPPSRNVQAQADPLTVTLADLLEGLHRVVVLGSPGGGKSTLVSKLAHDLSLRRARVSGRDLTPMVITLRQYGAVKEKQGHSILEFIESTANSDYSVKPPTNAVKHLLLNGRAVVLFDGLDELLDTTRRQRIASDIESFCRAFPSVPVLVTSREIGYLQAPLDETMFDVLRLAPFDQHQVGEYVKKWFSVGGEFTAEHQRERVSSFLQESERVSDLRSVPLLLALMCNIYRGEGYIPKNRPDVYAKCAEMLFEKWDKSRGIPVALPFDAHLRPAVMHLAHWLYTSESSEQAVTEHQLVTKATDYLWPRKFDDKDKAESAAKDFVDYCRGRAWVFTDTGLTKEGEPLFQFAHRTFLEYFTAQHFVRTIPGVSKLMEILLPRVRRAEWEVVAQLTCQIEDKQREGAGDEILTMLVKESQASTPPECWNLLLFVVRCLEFIVPGPQILRDAANALVQRTAESQRGMAAAAEVPRVGKAPFPSWEATFHIASENREYFADGLRQGIQALIESADPLAEYCGWEMTLFLDDFPPIHPALSTYLKSILGDRERLLQMSRGHFTVCRHALGRGMLTASDMARLHGVEALYWGASYLAFDIAWSPTANWIVGWLMGEYANVTPHYRKIALGNLDELGPLLIASATPWTEGGPEENEPTGRKRHKGSTCGVKLHGRALFAAFALTASILKSRTIPPIAELSATDSELITAFRSTYLSRFRSQPIGAVQKELQVSGLNQQEMQFALDWGSGKLNLVRGGSREKRPYKAG